jgi:crotonobetainyl-CoA:carnitine CoA-transferase CaiB-like acyl-CoA transferase
VKETGARFLYGIRVVEIGTSDTLRITGMLLADQGADVIRVETAHQDADGPLHQVTDRAKRRIGDFDKPGRRDRLETLLERADVLLEDCGASLPWLSSGEKSPPETLLRCSITPGAAASEKADRTWTEETVSADAGLYEPLGGAGRPRFFDLPIASVFSALHAANAVAMGLVGRARFGCNYAITVPIDRCALFSQVLSVMIKSKAPTAWEPFRMWSSPFMGVWKTAGDGYIYLHVGMPRHLRSFLFLLDRTGFKTEKNALKSCMEKTSKRDPAMLGGVREALGISRVLKGLFLRKRAEEWEAMLGKEGLCCSTIRSFDEWKSHEQVVRSGEIAACKKKDGRELKIPGPLFKSDIPQDAPDASCEKKTLSFEECLALWPAQKRTAARPCRKLPLEGIRVLDLSRVIAGPYTGRLLAEYGADVLHVSLRKTHLSWEKPFHIVFNPGKDSVTLDYSSPEGKEALKKIVEHFKPDIVLHNFLEDAARKIGLDYQSCRKWNDRIVYIDLQGFNSAGPWADRPGFEQNVQAVSGILSSYSKDGIPRILPVPVNDLSAGLIASFGAALSLRELTQNNRGNRITCFLSMPSVLMQLHRLNAGSGEEALRFNDYFKAADGWFLVSADRNALRSLCAIAGLVGVDLGPASDPTKALAPVFRRKPVPWWMDQVKRAGLEGRIHIIPRLRLGRILAREIRRNDPIFSYRNHEGIGDVLFAHSPVHLSPVGIKKLDTAKFIGSSTRTWAPAAGFDPARHSPIVPEAVHSSGLVSGIKRMLWIVSQLKWLAVIAYRQRALR